MDAASDILLAYQTYSPFESLWRPRDDDRFRIQEQSDLTPISKFSLVHEVEWPPLLFLCELRLSGSVAVLNALLQYLRNSCDNDIKMIFHLDIKYAFSVFAGSYCELFQLK